MDNTQIEAHYCDETQCQALQFMLHLRDETNGIGHSTDIINADITNVSLDMNDVKAIADILVWAYIGRHYTNSAMGSAADSSYTHLFFKFHPSSQVLRAIQPSCTFERNIYLTMILLTILVLVFIILARHIPMQWRAWHKEQQYVPVPNANEESENAQSTTPMTKQVLSVPHTSAIDFSQVRRR